MATENQDLVPFWLDDLSHHFDDLKSGPEGLSSDQAIDNLRRFGPNRLQSDSKSGFWHLWAQILGNPLTLVLLAASGLSAALGEVVNATMIVTILSLSCILEFTQTYRSQKAAQKLRRAVATTCTVIRSGKSAELPLASIVPGDVVELSAGSIVPGDGRLLNARDLSIFEAALTGESLPSEKNSDILPMSARSISEARNAVFMGTSVLSGFGHALIIRTGTATEFGMIARNLAVARPETEFERGSRAFGLLIMRTVLGLVAFVFLTNVFFQRPPLESLLFSVALAVGLTPEFLPMIISVSLATGASRLARVRVILKRPAALENLGSIDVLCSDKTGTLTAGKIKLEKYIDLDGQEYAEVLLYAALNSSFQTGIRSPLDEAILAHEHPSVADYRKLDEIPFDFNRRRLSVVVNGPAGALLVTKGAPESVEPLCGHFQDQKGQIQALDASARQRLLDTFQNLSREGYRVLAVARRELPTQADYSGEDEQNLCLVGLAAFLDPAREDARQTLQELAQDRIEVKIITGDNELVSAKICEQVGLPYTQRLLGSEVDGLSDEALGVMAEKTRLFARMSPAQKSRVITVLRSRGHVVGYLGDGINDAASLRAADIGITVENAVDVAKESADIILLDPGLKPIHLGVLEGRRSFGNIMKYILMGTSSNFGNMFSMAAASLFLPFLPLLPAQLLLNALLYDFSQISIPHDHVDSGFMQHPQRWNTRLISHFMMAMGPLSSLFDLLTFGVLLYIFQAGPELFRSGWFVESLVTQVLVIYVIRTSGLPWSSRPHPGLLIGGLSVVFLGSILPSTPLGVTLGFAPLPRTFYLYVAVTSLAYLSLVQFLKSYLYRRFGLTDPEEPISPPTK